MALRTAKKNTALVVKKDKKNASVTMLAHKTLLKPRITEKATENAMNRNVYVFDVNPLATKREIMLSVQELYKVTPIKVATVTIAAKSVVVRGKKGVTSGGKKAYVYIKKGEKIEIV